jgi:EAL domain-containing protein (putative c-di-GMP-specific phosphodiesterase class I)
LRRALERDELQSFFQPKLSIATGLSVGAEVLLRWRHRTRGLVPPESLANHILQQLEKHRLPGSAQMVDVTETSRVTDPILAVDTLEALRAEGALAAIDDFGNSFSSLIQLKRLPIDELKTHCSFVHEIAVNRDDAAIVQAIIGLAHSLDLRVVAEGVETPEQLTLLRHAQCDEAQGFLIARPLPADE